MAGTVINVLPKTTFDFSNQLGNAGQAGFPLALNIPSERWREVTLIVRLHSVTWSAGAAVAFGIRLSAPSAEDPSLIFQASSDLASVSITQANVASGSTGVLKVSTTVTSGLIGYLNLAVNFTQATSANTYTVVASVDLALKS